MKNHVYICKVCISPCTLTLEGGFWEAPNTCIYEDIYTKGARPAKWELQCQD